MTPVGALKASLQEGFTAPRPPWLSAKDLDEWKKIFLKNGFTAPTCWYKIMTNNMQAEEDARTCHITYGPLLTLIAA